MGKIIKNRIRGMNLWAKAGIVLTLTLALGTLMYRVSHSTPTANGRLIYSINSTTPQNKAYTASTNTFGAQTATIAGVSQRFMVDRASATRNEHIAGYVTSTGVLYILRWNGSAWTSEWNVTVGGNGVDGRRFDIAYEKTSGRAMVVYSTNTTTSGGAKLAYQTWDGTAWSTAANITTARSSQTAAMTWVKLKSNPVSGSNEIAAIACDTGTTAGNNALMTGLIWNGTSWTEAGSAFNSGTYGYIPNSTTPAVQNDLIDLAYESVSGDLLVVYTTTVNQYYRTYSASTWGTPTSTNFGNTSTAPLQMVAESDPLSNKILVVWNSSASDVFANVWSGTGVGTTTTISNGNGAVPGINSKGISAKWLVTGGTSYAVPIWESNTAGSFGYAYYTGTTWTAGASGFTYNSGTGASVNWMDTDVDPFGTDTLMMTFSTGTAGTGSLWAKRLVLSAGPTFTWSNADGGTAESTALASATTQNFAFQYDRLPKLTVGNGTNPANASVSQGSTGNAMDAFTLAMDGGTGTVSTLTLTGSANFTSSNVSAVKIYRDNGTIGTLDGADVLVATTTSWAANVATITFNTPEPVSSTAANYLVVVDVAAGAALANTLSGTITAATGSGFGTQVYSDTTSGTLTIIAPPSTTNGRVVYSVNTTTPQSRLYTAGSPGSFAAAAAMQTGAAQSWMVDRACPTRNEHIAGYVASGTLYIQRWNGSAWSAEWNVTGLGANNGRPFDIVYEKTSGRAMVVYATTTAKQFAYRYYDGTSWSIAANVTTTRLTGVINAIRTAANPTSGSNEIAVALGDLNSDLTAMIWNGSAWVKEPSAAITTDLGSITTIGDVESFDLAYENTTGSLRVGYVRQVTNGAYYASYTGGAWGTLTSTINNARAYEGIYFSTDPTSGSSDIVAALTSTTTTLYGTVWSGTAWSTVSTAGTLQANPAANKRPVRPSCLVSGATTVGIIVYQGATGGTINYSYTTNGGTNWTTTGTYTPSGTAPGLAQWIHIDRDPKSPDTMMVTFSDAANDLWAKRLVISSTPAFTWGNADGGAPLTAALASITTQNFSFAYDRVPVLTVGNGTNPANANAVQGSTNNAMDAFTLSLDTGSATVSTLTLTGSAKFTTTDVANIKIYRDNGTTVGALDASDTLVPATYTLTGSNATITFTTPEPVTTATVNYLVVIDATTGAVLNDTLSGTITAATGSGYGSANYNDTASATLTITAPKLLVGDGTNPASANAAQGSTGNAMDAFTLAMDGSTGVAYSVSTMTLTGTNFTAANLSNIKIYRDNGTTVGALDASDTLVATSYVINSATQATITFTTAENVTTTPVNYLVVADIGSGATLNNTLSGTITAVTGTNIGTSAYSDTASATLTITAPKLLVGDGTNPASGNAAQGSTGNAMDAFTLAMNGSTGAATVSTMTLTGTNFTAANLSNIKIYRDNGTTVGALDASDTLVATSYVINSATQATITFTTAESVTTTPVNYLVVVDIGSSAVLANTITGRITAATGTGIGTPSYSDSASATLTITAPKLTVGDGSNPGYATVAQGSTGRAMNSFTLAKDTGTGSVSTMTLTGSANFTTTNVASIKVYRDNGTLGNLDAADVLVATTYTLTGTNATITFTSAEPVGTTTVNYLVVVDVTAGAALNNTLSGTITAVTGTNLGTILYNDAASAVLTIAAKLPSASSSCASCHFYTAQFQDGSARNNPVGNFPGSHNTHLMQYGYVCSKCHVVPAAETSAYYGHRNQLIEMAVPIDGDTGGAYGKGASWTQTNSPAAFTACNNVYCHSQGTSKTSNTGETRTTTMSAPVTAITWGAADTCSTCHGFPPNYANGATTWGAAKANSHAKHTFGCHVCHYETTNDGVTITSTARHVNRFYNISAIGGGTAATFTYSYAATGGTCATIYCHNLAGVSQGATWGGTITLGCVDCHSKTIYRSKGRPGTLLSAVKNEFGLAWGHRNAARATANGAVTNADCIVCHLEGNYTTQKPSIYHADGNIDLRDPNGAGETPITNISGGTFTFQRFSTSYATGSRTSTGQNSDTDIANVITQKFCLACHDSAGATNPTARSNNGGTGTAAMPFGGINMGANYTVVNGAAAAGGLVDVKSQLALTNSSKHPVLGPLNRDFADATRLNDPYKPTGTRGTAGTLSLGVVINCFDCHNQVGTPLTRRTVAAHGNAVTIRGVATVGGNPAVTTNQVTFCIVCHASYDTQSPHGTGSAWSANVNSGMDPYVKYGCNVCHGSDFGTTVVRPVRAQDVHGNNALPTGGMGLRTGGRWATTGTPIAFIRNTFVLDDHAPKKVGATSYSTTCMSAGGTANPSFCGNQGTQNYSAGGTY